MILEERPVRAGLEPVATRLWFLETVPLGPFEKILPLPFAHLIVNLSEPYRLFDRSGAATVVADAFVSGLQSEYLVIESPSLIRHIGIELTPAGLEALTPGAGSASAGRVRDARELLAGVEDLVLRLRATTDATGALDEVEGYLGRAGPADRLVTAALELVQADPEATMGEAARRLEVSHGTLIARFRHVTGVTPKQYAQVLRFHRFVAAVHDCAGAPDWAGLAAASGYYDQPHVIRAFRRFSGWTPAQYYRLVAEHGPLAAHFVPLDQVPQDTDVSRVGRPQARS